MERVDVLEVILRLRAGQELHAPAFEVGGRKRHPGGHHVVLAETPVERILVPGHETRAVRLLDEEIGGPAQQIGPKHILGRIDDLGVMHELIHPGEEQVRLVPPVSLKGRPRPGFMLLEATPVVRHLGRRKRRHWEVIAVASIGIDCRAGKLLGHPRLLLRLDRHIINMLQFGQAAR